jgi:hypothetical protein
MGAPVDFVSTHNYPTGPRGDGSGCPQGPDAWVPDCFRDDVLRARAEIPSSIPFILSEFSVQVGEGMGLGLNPITSDGEEGEGGGEGRRVRERVEGSKGLEGGVEGESEHHRKRGAAAGDSGDEPPFQHDGPGAAAFVLRVVPQLAPHLDGLSYWTFSDVFEENSLARTEFHPVGQSHSQPFYGAMTLHGVPKPVWRAFQLLHTHAGTHSVPTAVSNSARIPLVSAAATVNVSSMAGSRNSNSTRDNNSADVVVPGSARLFLSHWDASGSAVNHSAVVVNVTVTGVKSSVLHSAGPPATATVWMIDDKCAANLLWQEMGSPAVPTAQQLKQLVQRSELAPLTVPVSWPLPSVAELQLSLEPNSAAVIELQL